MIADNQYFNKVPYKLLRLIILTSTNNKARVKVNVLSDQFDVLSGVKQGDPLSAIIINIEMNTVLKQMDTRELTSTRLKQIMAYADHIARTARTTQALIKTINQLKLLSPPPGLTVNGKKRKFLQCSRKAKRDEYLKVYDTQIEAVHSFKYLGSILNGRNEMDEEMKERIALGNGTYYANSTLFKSQLLTKRINLNYIFTIIRPIVTYGSEAWVVREMNKGKWVVIERKILRKIFGSTREEKAFGELKTN